MAAYEAVIGLEIHAQLQTASKLFCSCPVVFGSEPNENVCEICSGMPGALPSLNEKAVEFAVKAGLALNCQINPVSVFARKNYFYPDLPNGFQTSQYAPPICGPGYLEVQVQGKTKRIGITRIHLEDDAGKCVHGQGGMTYVDLNRAGTGLIEIVSDPDIRSAEEAAAYMREVHAILVSIGVTDGNMEEGSLRCDANVSIRPVGSAEFGTRAEIKNLNSFRNIQKAIECEIDRQKSCLEDGEPIIQETRLFDAVRQITVAMRSKEDAHDYRYFPNPDVPPVRVSDQQLALWKGSLPELPTPRKLRFIEQYGLQEEEAASLVAEKAAADYFEEAVRSYNQPRRIASLMQGFFLRECSAQDISPREAAMRPECLAELAGIIDRGLISIRMVPELFADLFATGGSAEALAKERGLIQVSDTGELETVVESVLAENPDEVAAYRGGKTKLLSFFVGQIMRKTKGKANPALVNELLTKKLQA